MTSSIMNFDEKVVETVRSALERLMAANKPVITQARLAPNGDLAELSIDQIYWACCKLHEAQWLRNRPLFETDHVYVSWESWRHQAYD